MVLSKARIVLGGVGWLIQRTASGGKTTRRASQDPNRNEERERSSKFLMAGPETPNPKIVALQAWTEVTVVRTWLQAAGHWLPRPETPLDEAPRRSGRAHRMRFRDVRPASMTPTVPLQGVKRT